ncbi:hypothetical protein [Yoonia sp.]|uniref:hypothetical protein n=1 Tax=Yoonia sp. TaxID=2212373 RepID=UPI002DFE6883|nr:hypothetical protein [Yoonia sp.]
MTSKDILSTTEALRRLSLKRGYARDAVSRARKEPANVRDIMLKIREIRPGLKARIRLVKQIKKMPGVITGSYSSSGTVRTVYREVVAMQTRHEEEELFTEDVLLYSAVFAESTRTRRSLHIARVSLNYHAIERLIERSDCEIGPGFLGLIDREANHILKELARDMCISHNEDEFIRSSYCGVWAGSIDASRPDPEWFASEADPKAPIFSVRTFLSPDEMHPSIWMKWNDGVVAKPAE